MWAWKHGWLLWTLTFFFIHSGSYPGTSRDCRSLTTFGLEHLVTRRASISLSLVNILWSKQHPNPVLRLCSHRVQNLMSVREAIPGSCTKRGMRVQRRDELSVETKQGQIGTHPTEAWRKEWRPKARPSWGPVIRKNSGMASEKPTGEVAQEPAKQHRMSMINRLLMVLWWFSKYPLCLWMEKGFKWGTRDRKDTWSPFKLSDNIALTYYLHLSREQTVIRTGCRSLHWDGNPASRVRECRKDWDQRKQKAVDVALVSELLSWSASACSDLILSKEPSWTDTSSLGINLGDIRETNSETLPQTQEFPTLPVTGRVRIWFGYELSGIYFLPCCLK